MAQNKSNSVTDERVINQVIYEKALLGRFPAYFQVAGDDRFHPCAWQMHPHLTAVVFSDGTTSHVTAVKPSPELAEKVGEIPNSHGNRTYVGDGVEEPESVKSYYDGHADLPETLRETDSDSDYQISTEAIAKLFSPEK